MQTRITQMLDIELPILAFSHCRDVVAAVTNSGGLGVFGAGMYTPEQLEIELSWLDEHTERPYGLDYVIPQLPDDLKQAPDLDTLLEMIPDEIRKFIDDLLVKGGIPELPPGEDVMTDAYRFSGDWFMEQIELSVNKHRIGFFASGLGTPSKDIIDICHARSIPVAALCGRPNQAIKHKAGGVDAVVAIGGEAAGHCGEISTMTLIPQVVDAVAPIPVIGGGGVACGRQLAATLALGAEAIWTGSVWLGTEEAETAPAAQEKLYAATSSDTVRSRNFSGKPSRMLKTAWTDAWESPGAPKPLPMPLQALATAEAYRRMGRAAESGWPASDMMIQPIGQAVGLMGGRTTCRQVVFDMMVEFANVADWFMSNASE